MSKKIRIGIIGMGTIGLELGQSLSRMGVAISGFDQVERIAGITDPEVNRCAIELMRREFPIHLGATATLSANRRSPGRFAAPPAGADASGKGTGRPGYSALMRSMAPLGQSRPYFST